MAGFGISASAISRSIALAQGHHLAPGLEVGFAIAAPYRQWCGGLIGCGSNWAISSPSTASRLGVSRPRSSNWARPWVLR